MIKALLLFILSTFYYLSGMEIQTDRATLFCNIIGEGEPILVIHGGPGLTHDYLLPQMNTLAENNRVIFYDQRSCGLSTGEISAETMQTDIFLKDIEAIRKELGYKKISVLGHSWGGFLAMQYAIHYPNSVEKIILLNSVPASSEEFSLFIKEWYTRTSPLQDKLLAITEKQEYKDGDTKLHEDYNRIIFSTYCHLPENANYLNLVSTQSAILNGAKVYNFLSKNVLMQPFNFHQQLRQIKVPALVVHGDCDPIPYSTAQNIHKSIMGSKFLLIKDCGHFPYIEQPKILFESLRNFLN